MRDATRDSLALLLLLVLMLFNSADAFLTWFAVSAGIASEVNLFMAWLLNMGPIPFFAFKLGLINWTAFRIYRYGAFHYNLKLIAAIVLIYAAVVVSSVWILLAAWA